MTIIAQVNSILSQTHSLCIKDSYLIIDQQSFDLVLETGIQEKGCSTQYYSCNLPSPEVLNEEVSVPFVSSFDYCQPLQKHQNLIVERLNFFTKYTIDSKIATQIQVALQNDNVVLSYERDINLAADITWNNNNSLTIKSSHNINVESGVTISNLGEGTLRLMAGIVSDLDSCTVNFASNVRIFSQNGGKVDIFYNPSTEGTMHKYNNPYPYHLHVFSDSLETFMLVNNAYDLRDINYRKAASYALSKDIDGSILDNFVPIGTLDAPFFGHFNGNGFSIKNIDIVLDEYSGIFGYAFGTSALRTSIFDFEVHNITVAGNYYIGIIAGASQNVDFHHIKFVQNNKITSQDIAGGVVGSGINITVNDIDGYSSIDIDDSEYKGKIAGALMQSAFPDSYQDYIGFNE